MCFQVIGMLVGAIDMVTRSATLNEASIRHVYAVILAQSNALVLLSENTNPVQLLKLALTSKHGEVKEPVQVEVNQHNNSFIRLIWLWT